MKQLTTRDTVAFIRLIKAAGVADEIKRLAKERANNTEADEWDIGFDLIQNLLFGISDPKTEGLVYEFFARPFEMTSAEVADLPLPDFIDRIKQLFSGSDMSDFFRSVRSALNLN